MHEILSILQGKKLHIILFAFIAVALNSCNINSYVPEGKYLVKKNTVVIEEKKTELSKSKLSSYITLKPYKAALQTNIPFWVYYKAEQRPNSKFWKWMKRNFAKEPVYYDKEEANRSSTQMMRYLDKVGHFHSDVSHSVKYRKKRAYITYDVKPTKPYHINKIDYVIDDSLMESFIMRDKKNFPINEGDIYNEFSIGDQRDMITDRLKNSGYYYFNRDNILYEVDSNFMNHSMSVTMKVANNPIAHRRYYINDISVYPNFSIFKMNEQPSDSATLSVKLGRRQVPNTLNFYYYGEQNVKPQTFSRAIQIIQGRPYRLNSVTNTYKGINNLHFFNNVNINFDSVANTNDSSYLLNCRITMQQNDRHSFTAQAEGTRSDSDLGIKGSVSYTNRNIFRGAEVFQVSLKGGFEAQKVADLGDSLSTKKNFYTREFGITTSLMFPKFLSPIPLNDFSRNNQPITSITLGYSTQVRYYYSRHTLLASYSYDWESSNQMHHTLSPVYINTVKITDIDPAFQAYLDIQTNQRKKDRYTDHLIFGLRYSYIYNTQNISKTGSFIYLRADLETSGNLLSLFNHTNLMTENDDHYYLFGIRYSQYARACVDFRQHINLGNNTWLVFRELVGLGVPYGNSVDIPFERSFYSGGANSLRGWTYHGVGPGSFVTTQGDYERIGDMQLEANAEFRFPISGIINGALFVDAGNVWLYKEDPTVPGGDFKFNEFYKQIAIDAGFGLRLDVSFLIIRADLAYAMRNPYPDKDGNYWRFKELGNLRLQFGIGYPF